MATVTGPGKYEGKFEQETDVDVKGKAGSFPVDDDQVNNLDFDAIYRLKLDDGTEHDIRITNVDLSETEPCVAHFELV